MIPPFDPIAEADQAVMSLRPSLGANFVALAAGCLVLLGSSLAIAQSAPPSEPAALARMAPLLAQPEAGGEKLPATRVGERLLIIASTATNGAIFMVSKPVLADQRTKAEPGLRARVVETDKGLALIELETPPTTDLGPIVRPARQPPAFASLVRVWSKDGWTDQATLQAPTRLFVLERPQVEVTGSGVPVGAPVLNTCDELIGVFPDRSENKNLAVAPMALGAVKRLIRRHDGAAEWAEDACEKGDEDGLDRIKDRAKTIATAATTRAGEARAAASELEVRISEGRPGAPGAAARLERLKEEAAGAEKSEAAANAIINRIEEFRDDHDRERLLSAGLVGLAVAGFGGAGFAVASGRRRAKAVEKDVERINSEIDDVSTRMAAKPWRNVTLIGPDGAWKVPADILREGGDPVAVGRSSERTRVTMVLPDVSRVHASLFVRNDTLMVRDEGSSGGTFVNDQAVADGDSASVTDGDELRFASRRFKVKIG